MNDIKHYPKISEFEFKINYAESKSTTHPTYASHSHEGCEIYINLSGDVSFVVEGRIYPIKPGDVIITRPFEFHHCVPHSTKEHKHFWVLFSAEGNEELFDMFFKRAPGEKNLLSLSGEKTGELISLCNAMLEKSNDRFLDYYNFFSLINLLKEADIDNEIKGEYPSDVIFALDYINKNFKEQITVLRVSEMAHVSINTLERHFLKYLGFSPSEYIKKKRLANAGKLLLMGKSVAEASEDSGFADYSAFIALFKKTYGITPFKYKKSGRINN